MKKFLIFATVVAIAAGGVFVDNCSSGRPAIEQGKPQTNKYAKGRKVDPAKIKKLREESFAAHGRRLKALPKITAATWDCRTLGLVPPIVDQGQCGSCWDFSGTGVVTSTFLKAGVGKPDGSFALSEQYTLDCGQNGGCNGDDNTTVLAWAKATGLVTTAQYGPYQGSPGACKNTANMTFYKIADWGFCSTSDTMGLATVQDIKNAMVAYGPIGAAIAADDAFSNNPPGQVFQGSGSTNIDHDIILCGWDDTKGAWLLRNSWGTSWCDAGYCWIKYGANLVGTEAVWAVVNPLPPPPPPAPPTPVPPAPPTPPPGSVTTFVINNPLAAGAYEVSPAGTRAALDRLAADIQAIQQLQSNQWKLEPPLALPGAYLRPVEKRLDALESNMLRLADSILTLQKLIEGKSK
jgi:hypothetical protein